jgi:sirohydrochlorin cobaltochelatase
MICGHGSREPTAVAEFGVLAAKVARQFPHWPVEHGYLEFARPILRDGLDKLRMSGVKKIIAVPGMLFTAAHVKNDVASVVNTYAAQYRNEGLQLLYGKALGIDPKMLRAAAERIEEAEQAAGSAVPRSETLLMVVGRGTSDPDANSDVAKVARMLWEGLGFGWGEACYSGVTFPLVTPALEHAVRLGYRRIIVFPYFLFTGVLVDRIHTATDEVAKRFPEIEFVKAPYLNDHPLVIETFVERILGVLEGDVNMNCQLCKYREQVLGFEAARGAPQASHHHHVEGIGVGFLQHHDHDHEH